MVSIINKELIASTHKTLIIGNLFDFIKNRENMRVSDNQMHIKPLFEMVCF